jgi:hypothetical protein
LNPAGGWKPGIDLLRNPGSEIITGIFRKYSARKLFQGVPDHEMNAFPVKLGITDLTESHAWLGIQTEIIRLGSFSSRPDQLFPGIPREITTNFFPVFIEDPSPSELFRIFLVCDISTLDAHAPSIRAWCDAYPELRFVLVVLDPSNSLLFSTSKARATAAVASLFPTARPLVLHCSADQTCTEPDIRYFFDRIEKSVHFAFVPKSAALLKVIESAPDFSTERSSACLGYGWICHLFGYAKRAINYYAQARKVRAATFWPPSPTFSELPLDASYETTLEIIVASLWGLLRAIPEEPKRIHDYALHIFSDIFANCETTDHFFFARVWMRETALQERSQLDPRTPWLPANLAWIIFTQSRELIALGPPPQSEFLAHLPEQYREPAALFEADIATAAAVWEFAPNHTLLLKKLAFQRKLSHDDRDGAFNIFKPDDLKPSPWATIGKLFEEIWDVNDELKSEMASLILRSNGTDAAKSNALDCLIKIGGEVELVGSLHEVVHTPDFFTEHAVFDDVKFTISFRVPNFLRGREVTCSVFLSAPNLPPDRVLASPKIRLKLDDVFRLEPQVRCLLVGEFGHLTLVMELGKLELRRTFALSCPLSVPAADPDKWFSLHLPYLRLAGTTQSAVFAVSHIDPSVVELTFDLQMAGLSRIRDMRSNREFQPGESVVVRDIQVQMRFLLIYEYQDEESDSVIVHTIISRGDGNDI